MAEPAKRVRRAPRAADGRPVVAVVGAASGPGALLARRLAAGQDYRTVVAIDAARPKGEKGALGEADRLTWRTARIDHPDVAQTLGGVDVVVHLPGWAPPFAPHVDGRSAGAAARAVLTAAAASGVGRAVVVTSAVVFGARADNPLPLADDSPLRATREAPDVADLLDVEDVAAQAAITLPGMRVHVLRPALLAGPGLDDPLQRYLAAPRLLAVRDGRTAWQWCHLDDLLSAVELVAAGGLDASAAAVACDGWLDRPALEAAIGRRFLEVPAAAAFGAAERLERLGLTAAPASQLQYALYPWASACDRLRDGGWRPVHTNADVLAEVLAGHRAGGLDSRSAALGAAGAAGATAAVLGAAVAVRRARRRRLG